MELGITDFAVPGHGLEEKLRVAEKHGLWLEIANEGAVWKFWRWKSLLPSFDVRVRSVQAFLQHRLSLLSRSQIERKAALNHVEQTIELASNLSAEHVVVALCYGKPGVENADEVLVKSLKELAGSAAEHGVTVGLEPLDRKRTEYRPTAEEVWEVVKLVDSEHVKLVLDTGHLWENGEDVKGVLEKFGDRVSEVHLKDSGGKAPGRGRLDFGPVVELCVRLKGLKCLEYRPGKNPEEDLNLALKVLRRCATTGEL